MFKQFPSWIILVTVLPGLQACTSLPKVELDAYLSASQNVEAVTNGVLDRVVPYERAVVRAAVTGSAPGLPPICTITSGGTAPYCYAARSGYAAVGDPPLVGAYRGLGDVVARFNTVLIAYADGVTFKLASQELARFSNAAKQIAAVPSPISVQTGAAIGGIDQALTAIGPLASLALGVSDRAELRRFVLENHAVLDKALAAMSQNSNELYGTVVTGTNILASERIGQTKALQERRNAMRGIIAGWAVLLDDQRRLLSELHSAIEDPDALETRVRNLNQATVGTRVDARIVARQLSALGGLPSAP